MISGVPKDFLDVRFKVSMSTLHMGGGLNSPLITPIWPHNKQITNTCISSF